MLYKFFYDNGDKNEMEFNYIKNYDKFLKYCINAVGDMKEGLKKINYTLMDRFEDIKKARNEINKIRNLTEELMNKTETFDVYKNDHYLRKNFLIDDFYLIDINNNSNKLYLKEYLSKVNENIAKDNNHE